VRERERGAGVVLEEWILPNGKEERGELDDSQQDNPLDVVEGEDMENFRWREGEREEGEGRGERQKQKTKKDTKYNRQNTRL
jgi:hypothetical protein